MSIYSLVFTTIIFFRKQAKVCLVRHICVGNCCRWMAVLQMPAQGRKTLCGHPNPVRAAASRRVDSPTAMRRLHSGPPLIAD